MDGFGLSSVDEAALGSMLLDAPFEGSTDGFVFRRGRLVGAGATVVRPLGGCETALGELTVGPSVRGGSGARKLSCTAADSGS